MKSICVFVGSSYGKNSRYLDEVKKLGIEIAKRNLHMIYGGGKLGLMGVLANTIIENGGKVTGVITQSLYEKEAHTGLLNLHNVDTMQERKRLMMELSDGFIACPGGLGTLEELFEIWNAAKIELHNKPLGIFNIDDYFHKLLEFIDYSVHEDFLNLKTRQSIKISHDPSHLLDLLIREYTSTRQ